MNRTAMGSITGIKKQATVGEACNFKEEPLPGIMAVLCIPVVICYGRSPVSRMKYGP